jgi:hypothetical protein
MNNRVIAKELSPDTTTVSEVMTPNPESVESDLNFLEALHMMFDKKYNNLPVVDDGSVRGLVDALDVVNDTMGDENGSEGWRTFWEESMNAIDDRSDTASLRSASSSRRPVVASVPVIDTSKPLNIIPRLQMTAEQSECGSQDLNGLDNVSNSPQFSGFDAPFTFKVLDPNGNLHKVSSSAERLGQLVDILCGRLKTTQANLKLTYKDLDGDDVIVTDDVSLSEAVDCARSKGDNFVRLRAEIDESKIEQEQVVEPVRKSPEKEDVMVPVAMKPVGAITAAPKKSNSSLIIAGAAVVGAVVFGALFMRSRRH